MNDFYVAILEERRRALRAELDAALGSNSEFVCEIGCGHGHFLTAYAEENPNRLCLGVDLVAERIERARRKRDRARLPNLHFIQAEARLFFETLSPAVSVSALFLLFPDPWPKLRHHKNRLVQAGFLNQVAARAKSGCRLYFRTDFLPYFVAARDTVRDHPCWQLADEPWPFEHVTVFQKRADTYASLVAVLRPDLG